MQNNYKTLNGYIEGYYGRLLTWDERDRIVLKLRKNKMNFYLYAPKEDDKHRLSWKTKYDNLWKNNFKNFCKNAKFNKVQVIVGLSPGLNFDFKDFIEKQKNNKISHDLNILKNKILDLLDCGAEEVALLFDDLPNNFKKHYGNLISEGSIHAHLSNLLSYFIKKPIYVVPRIYADQLIDEDKNYLLDYGKVINENNNTFYSGKNIVSQKINRNTLIKISKIIPTKIVIWDNFYANDYCPRRIFLGPLTGRINVENLMINPTGLIETDLLILDIIKSTKNSLSPLKDWKEVLRKHKVPSNFYNISSFFLIPDFENKTSLKNMYITNKSIENLDFLLWKWKSPLSREWYPFLLGLKHDLQLYKRELTSDRITKTQTKPLASYIFKI
tara:strand:- start:1462 stop:2616 length:1155 start_codon:yes stop_codon:yes gene_type:complete